MTFHIDNRGGGCNNPPFGKYVWEKCSGELGLKQNKTKQNKKSTSLYKNCNIAYFCSGCWERLRAVYVTLPNRQGEMDKGEMFYLQGGKS